MNQFLDFIPIMLFVAVFFTVDIYAATAALMVGVSLQLAVYWFLKRPIGPELKLTFWVSMVFGTLTLVLRDETFIQWKPTIVNWCFAGALLGTSLLGKANLIRKFLGKQLTLPDEVWDKLNYGWAAGFALAGVLNLVVAYNFSMEIWVSYKLIGGLLITFSYVAITITYLAKKGYLDEPLKEQ